MKRLLVCLSLSLLGACATTSNAAVAPTVETLPATPLDMRAEQLIAVLNDVMRFEDFFTASFLTAVPPAQIKAITASLSARYGKAIRVIAIEKNGPNSATLTVDYERALATIDITVEPSAPNKVAGLLAKGFAVKGDNIARIANDFRSLPGRAGYLVQKLDGSASSELSANEQYATGSTFKLYILAELASQIEAGQRKWSDVVPLDARAYSSSATQGWPRGTPVTLQTLATWMISVSDNAATDELIKVLGRDAVEKKLASIGHSAPDKALPLLTTVEAFALKSNAKLRARFETASEAQQRDILDNETAALSYDKIDLSQLGSGPVAIDSIEWSASPADIALLMNHLRRIDSKTALDILAVNKGVAPASAAKWKYLGYKGGSEPGVIAMNFLAQSKAGDWYAISGAWNNPAKEVDNAAFAALMTRLLDSVTN
jgi:beta-lactamase class A